MVESTTVCYAHFKTETVEPASAVDVLIVEKINRSHTCTYLKQI